MINYMKSEFYRTFRNRKLWILVAVFAFLLISFVLVLYYSKLDKSSFPYANTQYALGAIYKKISIMLLVGVVFSRTFHDREDKQHTIKHSVAFGIKRSTIYMGEFLVQTIVSMVLYIVLISVFAGLSFMLLTHSNQGELENLIRISLGNNTCMFAGLAVTHYFLMTSESESSASLHTYGILLFVPFICNLLRYNVEIFKKLSLFFPFNVMDALNSISPLNTGEGNVAMALVKRLFLGLGWLLFFCIFGVIQFQKKEIK